MKQAEKQFADETLVSSSQAPSDVGKEPFDLAKLRLSQDFETAVGSSKVLTTIPVRKPDPQAWFRVHPDDAFRMETAVLEHREDREIYLVERSLWNDLQSEIVPKVLYTTITRQGNLSIWSVRMPASDGRLDNWNRSAQQAAREAMKGWVRMASNRDLGAYDLFVPKAHFPDPNWPSMTFEEILRIAFRDHFIQDMDHLVIKKLQGRQ
jgi:hypothetical protein